MLLVLGSELLLQFNAGTSRTRIRTTTREEPQLWAVFIQPHRSLNMLPSLSSCSSLFLHDQSAAPVDAAVVNLALQQFPLPFPLPLLLLLVLG
jgi:hypothetical protein